MIRRMRSSKTCGKMYNELYLVKISDYFSPPVSVLYALQDDGKKAL